MDETVTFIHLYHRPGAESVQGRAETVRVTAVFEPLLKQSGGKTWDEIILPQHQGPFSDLSRGTVLPQGVGNFGEI